MRSLFSSLRPVSHTLTHCWGPQAFWAELRALVEQRGARQYFYWDELEQFFALAERHKLIDLSPSGRPVPYYERFKAARAAGVMSAHDFWVSENKLAGVR